MGEKVTNSVILQAILELSEQQRELSERVGGLSEQQKETSKRVGGLSEQQKDLSARVDVLSDQLAVTEQRLSHKITMVGNKIELVSNRLLETEADVKMLKEQH